TGDARLSLTDGDRIASHGRDIVEDPFFVAALFLHVFHERVLIGLVTRARGCECEQRKRMLHMVVSLGEKVEVERARCAGIYGLADKRNRRERRPLLFSLGNESIIERQGTLLFA